MNKTEMKRLVHTQTALTTSDVDELLRVATEIEQSMRYRAFDVFIDVLNSVTNEAFVVFHQPPREGESLYTRRVVGLEAKEKDEPGVYRTLRTNLNSVNLYANSQEQRLIVQRVYPIRNSYRTIGVIIVEEDSHEAFVNEQAILAPVFNDDAETFVADELTDELLIFNSKGMLERANKAAVSLYQKIGYIGSIQGIHYDNLALDGTTYDFLVYQRERKRPGNQRETAIVYGNHHLSIKKIWSLHEDQLYMIIRDVTDLRQKEAEIISKSVAIREIHHRVKNNLQAVMSLLRIQARRVESEEAKTALQESINRMVVIAQTHELLSVQVEDSLDFTAILMELVQNMERLFHSIKPLVVKVVMPQSIYLNGQQMVSIALVMNELIQNVYDHAYDDGIAGEVTLEVSEQKQIICISVIDQGKGYNVETAGHSSLGLMLIKSYVTEKLNGQLTIESDTTGTTTRILFKNTLKQ